MKDPNCPQHLPPTASLEKLATYLDDLVAYIVSGAALTTLPFRKKKFFHGWSPRLMASIYHISHTIPYGTPASGPTLGKHPWMDPLSEWITSALHRLQDRIRPTQKDPKLLPDTSILTIDGFQVNDGNHQYSIHKVLEILEYHKSVIR